MIRTPRDKANTRSLSAHAYVRAFEGGKCGHTFAEKKKRERETDRQTDIQTDRQTETDRVAEPERDTHTRRGR